MIDEQKVILQKQKELMGLIIDYQIKFGPSSVGWNVTISFAGDKNV